MNEYMLTRVAWQLVEAGWNYTPLIDSEDNATCAYCQLALDGWEKSDKPWWVLMPTRDKGSHI